MMRLARRSGPCPRIFHHLVILIVLVTAIWPVAPTWAAGGDPLISGKTPAGIAVVIDGGGSAIAADTEVAVQIPYAMTITSNTVLADQSGSIVVDIWVDSLANYPPTDADSITSSTPPTITSDTDSTDSTLTSWATSLSAGDTIIFHVDSCTTIERCTIVLGGTR